MARSGGTAIQEELYSTPDEPAREELDDARLLDLDAEKESPFLRAQKRVSVRRVPLPKKTAKKLLWVGLAVAIAGVAFASSAAFYEYGAHSWRFRLDSSDNIEMAGLSNVTRSQIVEVMGGDIGRNVFFIPLDRRQKQLAQIPWVESASVMRFAPNRLRIEIHERTPVAFARIGSKVMLIDAGGVLMELSAKKKFSFPVIVGMSSGEPLATRSTRMRTYNELVREFDSGGGHYSQDVSEVDLSDMEDVKILTNDPDGEVLVHLGSANFLDRFKVYIAHLREWRQQFAKLESVDLRYERQIIVNPDLNGPARQPALSAATAKAAIRAGVKPSALISRGPVKPSVTHVIPLAPPKSSFKKLNVTVAAHNAAAKDSKHQSHWHKRAAASHASAKPAPAHTATIAKRQVVPTSQKPSPAIPKEQENR